MTVEMPGGRPIWRTGMRSIQAIALASCLGLMSGCFAIRQAVHHNNLINSRRPVEGVLEDPATSEETRKKLFEVKDILAFSHGQGLNTEGAYQYYVQLDRGVVSYLVQAAEADRLEPVTWWFPIVGRVPYLGYFDRSERDEKAMELRSQGYDVHTGASAAFSSLGWFEDPIFSSMLKRSREDLAHLFFHELTHRTLWVPGSVQFNENLAEYIAYVLVQDYLKFRADQEGLERYLAKRRDKAAFKDWLSRLKKELEKLYAKGAQMPKDQLLEKKKAVFQRFQSVEKPDFKVVDYVGRRSWNNGTVLAYSLYSPDLSRFEQSHACLGEATVIQLLRALEAALEEFDQGFDALDALCRDSKSLDIDETDEYH